MKELVVGNFYKSHPFGATFIIEVIERLELGYDVKVLLSENDINDYDSVGRIAFLRNSAVSKWTELTELDKALL